MDFCFRELMGDSQPSNEDVICCPFLRNITEPTNLSFASSLAFPRPIVKLIFYLEQLLYAMVARCGRLNDMTKPVIDMLRIVKDKVRGAKGPIFEDGPNFDMAFRLFHGQDGVVPLSGRSYVRYENFELNPPAPQFNPLAAKAATISLSGFGPGGPFGFDAFSEKWKNQKKKSESSKRESSSKGGNKGHEALSNEWLQTGNCPIAKSYRAVSGVLPLVAKVFQPPPGVKFECPPAIVAARAALARTAFAKNLRPQPLPNKVLAIGLLGMAANVPLGIWREHTKKFSPAWFAAVHAAVPFIAMLRKCILMPKSAMVFTIGASVLGQVIGSRAERYRLKAKAAQKVTLAETPAAEPKPKSKVKPIKIVTGSNGGLGEEVTKWDPLSIRVGEQSSSTGVCCSA